MNKGISVKKNCSIDDIDVAYKKRCFANHHTATFFSTTNFSEKALRECKALPSCFPHCCRDSQIEEMSCLALFLGG